MWVSLDADVSRMLVGAVLYGLLLGAILTTARGDGCTHTLAAVIVAVYVLLTVPLTIVPTFAIVALYDTWFRAGHDASRR
jgi:hypothetical protein